MKRDVAELGLHPDPCMNLGRGKDQGQVRSSDPRYGS